MYSYILKNATVIDGTGKPRSALDVAINDEVIVNMAPSINQTAHTVIDASGKIVCPGFIDIQNHSDSYGQLFDNASLDSMLLQGITTILVGNCGASLAPLVSPDSLSALSQWHDSGSMNVNWSTFGEFVEVMKQRQFGCNVGSMVGLETLWGSGQHSAAYPAALALAQNALEEGAFGISGRLGARTATKFNLEELVQIASKNKALVSIHLEQELTAITEDVEYVADLAVKTKGNIKIAHLKLEGRGQWEEYETVLEILETARHRGANLHFDVYPYDSTWQSLRNYLPEWAAVLTPLSLRQAIEDKGKRPALLGYFNSHSADFRSLTIASTAHDLNLTGKKLAEIAKGLGLTSEEALLEIIRLGGTEVLVFDQSLDPSQVWALANHPLAILATDGAGYAAQRQIQEWKKVKGKLIHPRCFGTTAVYLRSIIDQNPAMLEQSIGKMTSVPAVKMGLEQRGRLAVGKQADLVIFDPEKIKSNSTLTNPYSSPAGIEHVFVNGQEAVRNGELVNSGAGRFLIH